MKKQRPNDRKEMLKNSGHLSRPPRLDGETKGAHQDRAHKKRGK